MDELEHFLARRKLQNLTERLNRIADAMREETMRKEFERQIRKDCDGIDLLRDHRNK